MQQYIEEIWLMRDNLAEDPSKTKLLAHLLDSIIDGLNQGIIRVCQKEQGVWHVNHWVKKAILLYFMVTDSQIYTGDCMKWYDKISPKFHIDDHDNVIKEGQHRIIPGAFIRTGCYIGKKVIVMPSFVNIGAYIGDGSMIDTWATVGSCVQVGKNCHISGGAGLGGVLEPIQANPVIIEDNCFIGARSEIVEGVIVEEGSVISMGVFIGASTKIVDRHTGNIIYGRVPAYSVVVPGNLPAKEDGLPGLYCAVIIKQVDKITRSKTSINELLRY